MIHINIKEFIRTESRKKYITFTFDCLFNDTNFICGDYTLLIDGLPSINSCSMPENALYSSSLYIQGTDLSANDRALSVRIRSFILINTSCMICNRSVQHAMQSL